MARQSNRREAKRLRLFTQGAEALQRVIPTAPYCYACPVCLRGYPPPALDAGRLTLDHVPPRSVRGQRLVVLTCHDCNTGAGATLNKHMLNREQILDFARGTMTRPSRVRFGAAGENMKMEVLAQGRNVQAFGLPKANNPTAQRGVERLFEQMANQGGGDGTEFRITFLDSFNHKEALLDLLRSGYLVAFAVFGYRYILRTDLRIIRNQLADPDKDTLRVFSITSPEAAPEERRVMIIEEPKELRSAFVQIGRHGIFLPHLEPKANPNLYQILAQRPGQHETGTLSGGLIAWPQAPLLALDMAQRNS